MSESLCIIIDVSGSMQNMGKIHLLRNLCRYVAQLRLIDQQKYAAISVRFYQWAQAISEFTLQSDGDILALYAKGSSHLGRLSEFLSQNLDPAARPMVLILSDGYFSNSDISAFQQRLSTLSNLSVRTIAVGADANVMTLRKLSTNDSVYLAENISAAIDSVIFGSDKLLLAPISTAEILNASTCVEEPEEDWDV